MGFPENFNCRICAGSVVEERLDVREMMFGTRKHFAYARCGECRTLQIEHIPADLGSGYPSDYYSFAREPLTWRKRLKLRVAGRLLLSPLAAVARRLPVIRRWLQLLPDWLREVPALKLSDTILDVGTGGGVLLGQLAEAGFTHLHGIDPFIDANVRGPGFTISKCELVELDQGYDLVMMHHALEHVPDPLRTLADLRRVTNPNGHVIVSIPIAQGKPWRDFRENWVHLDAPRHLHLFTVESFAAAAASQGLNVEKVGFDTSLFTLAGSRLYAKDVPLYEPDGTSNLDRYTNAEKIEMGVEAEKLNRMGDADTAFFLLSPA